MDSLTLSFDFPKKGVLVYELASAFVLHVLYVRGILPEPFEGLHQKMLAEEEDTPSQALKYSDRKKRKSIQDVVDSLAVIRSVSEGVGIEKVAVLLGPSANNPKEVYTVEFHSHVSDNDNILSAKQINQAKRHLIHKLIEHQSTEDCPPPSKANVFFAVKPADPISDSIGTIMESEVLIRVFSFRESFKIKNDATDQNTGTATKKSFGGRRKAKPLNLRVLSKNTIIQDTNDVPVESEDASVQGLVHTLDEVGSRQGMWLVLSKGIKNIPA